MIGRWERKAEDGSRSLLRSYTIAFAALCLVVFVWYYAFGRTLIWKGDGWSQHYKALLYYAKYLRCILKNFFTGSSLSIPSFDIAIGEGNDILETFHYYVIGDPFALSSSAGRAGWHDYPGTPVFYSWQIDEVRRPQSVEMLKEDSTY